MKYFIDFDGTICPNNDGPPQKECIEVLKRLKECNHEIIIYSCRSNPECVEDANQSTQDMIAYLNAYGVPFDGIEKNKPFFNYYIDDRAVGVPLTSDFSVDWAKIKLLNKI